MRFSKRRERAEKACKVFLEHINDASDFCTDHDLSVYRNLIKVESRESFFFSQSMLLA